ncbi:CRISPR-associated protein Csx16 [Billgrantia campisalis]
MTTYVVSRHPGAVQWLVQQGVALDHCLPHLHGQELRAGDRVVGTLPLQLACWVCEQGAEYWHLGMDIPAQWRGQELTPAQMDACRARLERFEIQRISVPKVW